MQESNWFSAPSALRVYGQYLNLDKDHNGMLSKEELSRYNNWQFVCFSFLYIYIIYLDIKLPLAALSSGKCLACKRYHYCSL